MNAFEQIVSDIMQRQGFWTRVGYKVELTSQEKTDIGTPSMPSLEIDVLAYKASSNELCWIECKSYLDSSGVKYEDLFPEGKNSSRYKIFVDENRRKIATNALSRQIEKDGLALPNLQISHWLVAGKIVSKNQDKLEDYFKQQGWELKTRDWLVQQLESIAGQGWDDNVTSTVAKLFKRK